MCVVKQLGINLRITVQLILNAKDAVCLCACECARICVCVCVREYCAGGGALTQRRGNEIQAEVMKQDFGFLLLLPELLLCYRIIFTDLRRKT